MKTGWKISKIKSKLYLGKAAWLFIWLVGGFMKGPIRVWKSDFKASFKSYYIFSSFGNIPQKRKYLSSSPLCFLKESLICSEGKTAALELNFRSQQTTKPGSVWNLPWEGKPVIQNPSLLLSPPKSNSQVTSAHSQLGYSLCSPLPHNWLPLGARGGGFLSSFPREQHEQAALPVPACMAKLAAVPPTREHVQCLAEVVLLPSSSLSVPLSQSEARLH